MTGPGYILMRCDRCRLQALVLLDDPTPADTVAAAWNTAHADQARPRRRRTT